VSTKDIFTQNPFFIQGTKMSQVQVSVSVDNAHLPQIGQISQQLQSSGMNVEQTLFSIGVINGSIPSDRLNSLYQLAPPNSDIQ
jgi:hypothetical protein